MRVAVTGPSGMLGRHIVDLLGDEAVPIYQKNIFDVEYAKRLTDGCDGIINCAGVIPTKSTNVIDLIRVNSLMPHVLAGTGLRCVLVSTDCVFSGRTSYRGYLVSSIPDPRDYYGKSKNTGEVIGPNSATIRTSFIGCDHGILSWVLSAGFMAKSTGSSISIDGWKNALWSGSTVTAVAIKLIEILRNDEIIGIQHLATERAINKYDLILKLVEVYKLESVVVKPQHFPVFNRALTPTIVLPNIDIALAEFPCKQAGDGVSNSVSNSLVNV